MARSPQSSNPNRLGSSRINNANAPSIADFSNNPKSYGRSIRSRNIPAGAEPPTKTTTNARFRQTSTFGNDWRVKLSVPALSTFRSSPILQPLADTDYNVVFPITPNINLVTTANYDSLDPVHSNYPFPQYINSRTEDINISGEFPVQRVTDGQYWVAAVHFFRSVTKMFYGETSNKGSPPPIIKLNGYGDYVLNNVPVVVTQFSVDLPNNVDYIEVPVENADFFGVFESKYQMVPTNSMLNVTVKPIYSRTKIEQFSLDRFINGDITQEGYI